MQNKIGYKNLVIAPHVDDEVLGCGGILDSTFFVYFCGVDLFHVVSKDERLKEVEAVSKFLGYSYTINHLSEVNNYNMRNFINIFQYIINLYKPTRVFIPHSSYNQDHQEIYKASMVALRPHDRNHCVPQVLEYEMVDCFWENAKYDVNYFVPIDIKKKLVANRLHKSQVRQHRNEEFIKAVAVIRGNQSNCSFAEAFVVKRWIEPSTTST